MHGKIKVKNMSVPAPIEMQKFKYAGDAIHFAVLTKEFVLPLNTRQV